MATQTEQPESMHSSSHEQDFYRWSLRMAELIRAGRFEELDRENVAAEIEKVAQDLLTELKTRTRTLLAYMLKRDYQPANRNRPLENTVHDKRSHIELLMEDIPSLRRQLPVLMHELYEQAVAKAMRQTGLERPAFPAVCPYTATEVYGAWVQE
jgi:hypothetical protein